MAYMHDVTQCCQGLQETTTRELSRLSPPLPLEVGPLYFNPDRESGGALAEIKFGAFQPENVTSGGNFLRIFLRIN